MTPSQNHFPDKQHSVPSSPRRYYSDSMLSKTHRFLFVSRCCCCYCHHTTHCQGFCQFISKRDREKLQQQWDERTLNICDTQYAAGDDVKGWRRLWHQGHGQDQQEPSSPQYYLSIRIVVNENRSEQTARKRLSERLLLFIADIHQ